MAGIYSTHCRFSTRIDLLVSINRKERLKFTSLFTFFLLFDTSSVNWVKRCYLFCSLYDMLPEINPNSQRNLYVENYS
jgi:hypothetical protein